MPEKLIKIMAIKLVLCESQPEIWRRFEIASDMTLGDLHSVIQFVMGWKDCHLHDFVQGKRRYSKPEPEEDVYGSPAIDEDEVQICEVLKRKSQKIGYTYDMGDCWEHTLVLENISEPDPNQHYPACIEGAYACPPEDCGGMWGYYNMLEALADPEHEEHETFVEWIGLDFDAENFDLAEANKILKDYDNYVSGWD